MTRVRHDFRAEIEARVTEELGALPTVGGGIRYEVVPMVAQRAWRVTLGVKGLDARYAFDVTAPFDDLSPSEAYGIFSAAREGHTLLLDAYHKSPKSHFGVELSVEPFSTASPESRAQEIRRQLAALSEPRSCVSKLGEVPGVTPKLTIYCEGDDW